MRRIFLAIGGYKTKNGPFQADLLGESEVVKSNDGVSFGRQTDQPRLDEGGILGPEDQFTIHQCCIFVIRKGDTEFMPGMRRNNDTVRRDKFALSFFHTEETANVVLGTGFDNVIVLGILVAKDQSSALILTGEG